MIAFDLDGTLFHHGGRRPNYNSPGELADSQQPFVDRCARVRQLIDAGQRVDFITGRNQGHFNHTLEALRRHIHPDIQPEHLHTQAAWAGYEEMARFKADVLDQVRRSEKRATFAQVFVGDHPADALAAKYAGCHFSDADTFQWVA